MLAIQIGNEMLELPRGTTLDMVEENPFLQFAEDKTLGNYSLPFELYSVSPNVRLTNYAAIIQKIVDNDGIEARLYSNGQQHSVGKIFVEKADNNLNNLQSGKLSCYYLFGSSDFYSEIKGKKLREINMGGDRSFAWDAYATSGAGFWGHMTTVARSAPNFDDYAIHPVINKGWTSETNPTFMDVMNNTAYTGGAIVIPNFVSNGIPGGELDIKRIVPFPYLHYVFERIADFTGWKFEGDYLNDNNFLKIDLLNAQAIDWGYIFKSSGAWNIGHRDPVVFNLQDNLPDVEIGEFMVAIRKRLGLWYDFDYYRKKITVTKLDDLTEGEVKDMTPFASPLIPKKIDRDRKIYALRNDFKIDGGDSPDLSNVSFQGNLNEVSDLPAAAEALYAHVYLIVGENNYYICLSNNDTQVWEWTLFSYNIFDHVPDGANQEIRTAATTVGMEIYTPHQSSSFPLEPLLPRLDVSGRWFGRTDSSTEEEWGIHLCFYHGPASDLDGRMYPYGSSHIYDKAMNQVAEWGLPFHCYKTDGTDVGLYEIFWRRILEMISGIESFEASIYLPLIEFMNLKFSDRLVIAGVMMFLKQKKSSLEYKKQVDIEAVRIL